ncbi:MAG TPA: hypothetical protein VM186_06940 [Planctomycetota bacterium]|nr:hypothetical protein [Planctomycetota bacterium]
MMVLPAWIAILAGTSGEALSLPGLGTGSVAMLLCVLLLFRIDSTRRFSNRAFLISTVEGGSLPATRETRAEGGRRRLRRLYVRTRLSQANAVLAGMPALQASGLQATELQATELQATGLQATGLA